MDLKRTTEIFIETKRRFIIRPTGADESILCPVCGEQMLTAETSAILFHINGRRVYQHIEAGTAHFLETASGATFVCSQSLEAAIRKEPAVPSSATVELMLDAAPDDTDM